MSDLGSAPILNADGSWGMTVEEFFQFVEQVQKELQENRKEAAEDE